MVRSHSWSSALDWKSGIAVKVIEGSNPSLTANNFCYDKLWKLTT